MTRLVVLFIIILFSAATYAADPPTQKPPSAPAPSKPAPDPAPSKPPATSAHPAGAQEIQGELLKMDKGACVLKDSFGKEVQLRINTNTKLVGEPKPGDKVEVSVMEGGIAMSIKKL